MAGSLLEQPHGRLALINGRIILSQEIAAGKAVIVDGGKILDVVDEGGIGLNLPKFDVGGRYISPGLVDIHNHGALGCTFNEPTAEAFKTITRENSRHGVTSMLATLATAQIESLVECLECSRQQMYGPPSGTEILGVHLEGPYFSRAQAGAQDPANLRTPDDGSADRLLEYADILRIVTFAPELSGALALTARLAKLGIVPAAGHSSATDVEVAAAIQAGLRHAVHLWSGQSTTVRAGPWRKPGLLEASLASDSLSAEIISDHKHLPSTLIRLAYKCLGSDRLCVVSDATSGAGLADGSRFRMGGLEYEVHDGVGMLLDRTAFAGSTTLLNQMVRILRDEVGLGLVEIIRMVALTPARVIGLEARKGSLEAGKDADIAIFEDDFSAWRTMVAGRWVYAA